MLLIDWSFPGVPPIRVGEMPAQREIPLYALDGKVLGAGGVGNNAAWICPCGRSRPPVGSLSIAREVDCPDCSGSYRLVSTDADNPAVGHVARVKELDSNRVLPTT